MEVIRTLELQAVKVLVPLFPLLLHIQGSRQGWCLVLRHAMHVGHQWLPLHPAGTEEPLDRRRSRVSHRVVDAYTKRYFSSYRINSTLR